MAKFSTVNVLMIASAAFIGGLVINIFTRSQSSQKGAQKLLNCTESLKDKLREAGKEIKNKNLPNLYEATAELGLTDQDLIPNG